MTEVFIAACGFGLGIVMGWYASLTKTPECEHVWSKWVRGGCTRIYDIWDNETPTATYQRYYRTCTACGYEQVNKQRL